MANNLPEVHMRGQTSGTHKTYWAIIGMVLTQVIFVCAVVGFLVMLVGALNDSTSTKITGVVMFVMSALLAYPAVTCFKKVFGLKSSFVNIFCHLVLLGLERRRTEIAVRRRTR